MNPQPFRRDSYRNPHGIQSESNRNLQGKKPASAGKPGRGMGTGTGSTVRSASTGRFDVRGWVARNLPDEHPGYAYHAAALAFLRHPPGQRREPTKAEVMAILEARGKAGL